MNIYFRVAPLMLSRPTCSVMLQKRLLYEQTRSGSLAWERKKLEMLQEKGTEMERFKRSVQRFKNDSKWYFQTLKDSILLSMSTDNKRVSFEDQEVVKFWDFNQANNDQISSYRLAYKNDKLNDMNNWYVTCDADFDVGFSTCSWSVSPSGHGLFSGVLDKTLPKDGRVVRTGYAYLGSYKSRKHFFVHDTHDEFEPFTHIVLRVRGDGRRYNIIFDTSSEMDITWFDRYQYMLFTHGGPYWQYVKIPLTRFYFHYQGFVQDYQSKINPQSIRNVGILAYDIFPGPFSLEIDYIGFMVDMQHNDTTEYEAYYHESSILKSYGSV